MGYSGVVRGRQIELDVAPPMPDGTRVRISITSEPAPPRGSPSAVLRLVDTLTATEANALIAASRECRRVDAGLWTNGSGGA